MGGLVVFLLVGVTVSASAADTKGLSTADQIKQARDQAGKTPAKGAAKGAADDAKDEKPAKADSAGTGDAAGEEAEAEKEVTGNEALPLGTSSGGLFNSSASEESGGGGMGDSWLLSTLAALGVVLAIVFGIRWVLRRGGVVSLAAPQGAVVEVLSRTTVAPRSHVILMRVGQRILIVSDSSAGMRTLASVDDPAEFAELLGAVDAAKPTSMSKSFSGVMKKLGGQWSSEDQADLEADTGDSPSMPGVEADGVGMDRTRNALANVRGRLAALSGVGGKS